MPKNKDKPKLLVLLDAHAIIHRAYHALPEFLSSSGMPTGALYGLSTMLMKIVGEQKPDYIVACYDRPEKTFRHEAYKAYKAGRVKAEDALVAQLESSREIFEAFNIPIYDAPGFEADDVIGTIVAKLKRDNGVKIIIASGDMDTMQLVDDEKVQVYTLKRGINDTILYDEAKVIERFGFRPALIADYKGLRGDPSDNIVGIKGIGEKTATELIIKFGTIEEIYKKKSRDLEKAGVKSRIAELISEHKEVALFSKTLAQIRFDTPVKFQLPEKSFWENADLKKIEQVFVKFEFRSLFARLRRFFGDGGGDLQPALELSQAGSVNPEELRETSIALWILNSDLLNPGLEDILHYSRKDNFSDAKKYIFSKLKEDKLERVFEEIEKPIMPIVKEMEERGALVDPKYFLKLSREYHQELDKLIKEIYKLAGGEFNVSSPKQLAEVLFEKLGLKATRKRGASGSFSTRAEVLEELSEEHPIISKIIAHRELAKLLSTYIDVIPKMAGRDGRLHAKFLQNGSVTGRFSSQDPNLQNLPVKSDLGKRIRGGFIAPAGHKLVAFDYSQVELRVAAMLSRDKKLAQIFQERRDIHAGVASFVFGVPPERVTSEMRRQAKVINFGILYGMGVTALRKNLGGSREEAQKFYDNYFREFSGIRDYLESVKTFARKHGYTETLFGRRRYFPNINSRIPFLANMAGRTAINAPLQGTAADIIKLAIRYADEALIAKKIKRPGLSDMLSGAHLILVIHDELVYEIQESQVAEASEVIKEAMENALVRSYLKYKSPIPLSVREGTGDNLGQLK